MPKSLLEELPEIVANGRKQAERILESLESQDRASLQAGASLSVGQMTKDMASQSAGIR